MKTAFPIRRHFIIGLLALTIAGLATISSNCCYGLGARQETTKPAPPVAVQEPANDSSKSAAQSPEQESRKLFDGETMVGWEIVAFGGQDKIEVVDGSIVAEAGYPLAGIASTLKDLPRSGYTLALEAQKIDGTDFFCCVTFPVKEQHCSLVVGGWGGTLCGISCIDGDDASHNSTKWLKKFERGQWYDIEIKVTDDRIVCSVDDEVAVDLPLNGIELSLRSEVHSTTPIGICAFETKSAWRNIRLTLHTASPDSGK